jgi:cytochrome c oxidase subunit 4
MGTERTESHVEKHPSPRAYVLIGIVLAIITAIEVAAFYLKITPWLLAMVMLLLSASKFVLVVGYYMHLGFDDRRFLGIFAFPFFIALSMIIALLAIFQNLTR